MLVDAINLAPHKCDDFAGGGRSLALVAWLGLHKLIQIKRFVLITPYVQNVRRHRFERKLEDLSTEDQDLRVAERSCTGVSSREPEPRVRIAELNVEFDPVSGGERRR